MTRAGVQWLLISQAQNVHFWLSCFIKKFAERSAMKCLQEEILVNQLLNAFSNQEFIKAADKISEVNAL